MMTIGEREEGVDVVHDAHVVVVVVVSGEKQKIFRCCCVVQLKIACP